MLGVCTGAETVTYQPLELEMVGCDWQRTLTVIVFWPVETNAWEALGDVDQEEAEDPSPQFKLYSSV